jgi:hypothetical protein
MLPYTNLILIFGSLVLDKKLQSFFPNGRLYMTTSAMTFLGLIRISFSTIFLGLVSLTDHLGLAVRPHNGHARLGIANVTDLVGEIGIGLRHDNGIERTN